MRDRGSFRLPRRFAATDALKVGAAEPQDVNDNDRAIVGLVMLAHGLVHTYELSIPILVGIWLVQFPVTEAAIGVAVTVGTAFFGFGALPGGLLADAYGSKRLIVLCMLGMGASFVVLGLSGGLASITVALSLWGIAASVYHPAGLSLISKGVDQRGTAFAYHGMAGNVGIGLGPMVTAVLLIAFDWRLVVTVLAIPAGVGALVAATIDVDETAAVGDDAAATDGSGGRSAGASGSVSSLSEFLANSRRLFVGGFVVVFAIMILSGLYYRGITTFLQQLLADLPMLSEVTVGEITLEPSRFVYAGLLTVGIAGQYAGGKLTDRIRTEWGLAGGFGALAVVALLFLPAASAGLVPLLVASALLGFFLFTVQPMYQASVAEYSPPEARGLSYGYSYLAVFGVGAVGAVVAGTVLTYTSEWGLFLTFTAVAGLASLLGLGLGLRGR